MDQKDLLFCIRGAGDIASGVGVRLCQAGYRRIVFLEREQPLAVRRLVSFSEAVYRGEICLVHEGEEFRASLGQGEDCATAVAQTHARGELAVLVDPRAESLATLRPDVLIDAMLAKRNLGTHRGQARLVIGLGPGFTAGGESADAADAVDAVIETQRGPRLGQCILSGGAEPNTGIPAAVQGLTTERVLRSPACGFFETSHQIGDAVRAGECVALVAGEPVFSSIAGVLRGFLRHGVLVGEGTKVGDVEVRPDYPCDRISDKALCIGDGVCGVLNHFFRSDSF